MNMSNALLELKAVIRGILCGGEQMSFHELELCYTAKTGTSLPFRKFGYSDVLSLLVALPDTVKVSTAFY